MKFSSSAVLVIAVSGVVGGVFEVVYNAVPCNALRFDRYPLTLRLVDG